MCVCECVSMRVFACGGEYVCVCACVCLLGFNTRRRAARVDQNDITFDGIFE